MSGSYLEAVSTLVEQAIRGFGLDPEKVRAYDDRLIEEFDEKRASEG